jgi:SAM-dependent methyltransferase
MYIYEFMKAKPDEGKRGAGGPQPMNGGGSSPCPCCGMPTGPASVPGIDHGDPAVFGRIPSGAVVVVIGPSAGRDTFFAAEAAGADGRAIGIGMPPKIVDLSNQNIRSFRLRTGLDNVRFERGGLENLPLENGSVDCVLHEAAGGDRDEWIRISAEARRILKPGGRFLLTAVVREGRDPGLEDAVTAAGFDRVEKIRTDGDADRPARRKILIEARR